jgi:hypothetical protein
MGTPTPGPGKFSQRTDKAVANANRNLPNADYGEQAQYQAAQQGMQKPQEVNVSGMNFNDLFGNPAQNVVGLGEPSQMPNTPVTDGADLGPGGDSSILSSSQKVSDTTMVAYLPALEFMANQPGSSDAARNLVRNLKASM